MKSADLNAEDARVQDELITFRTECLPALLRTPLAQLMPDYVPDHLRTRTFQIAGRLSEWENAAIRLAEAFPLGLSDKQAAPLLTVLTAVSGADLCPGQPRFKTCRNAKSTAAQTNPTIRPSRRRQRPPIFHGKTRLFIGWGK